MKLDRRFLVLDREVSKESCTGTAFSAPEGRKILAHGKGASDGGHSRPLPWVGVRYIEPLSTAGLFEDLKPAPRAGVEGLGSGG